MLYKEIQEAYDFYNKELFNNELPQCILNFERQKGSKGYFSANRFASDIQEGFSHEIDLNPEFFKVCGIEQTLSTLVHEMVHLKIFIIGKHGRGRYHNKPWAEEMERVGLIPSNTGAPGGKKTGDKMTHYIDENGLFHKKTIQLLSNDFVITWYDRYYNGYLNVDQFVKSNITFTNKDKLLNGKKITGVLEKTGEETRLVVNEKTSGKRYKYSCECSSVWGKDNLNITCNICGKDMEKE